MSKSYRKVQEVQTVTRTKLVEIKCDVCGSIAPCPDECFDRVWKKDTYDVAETEVKCKTGQRDYASGSGVEISIDICPDCFVNKLMPWVKSHGGEPKVEEWYF